MSILKSIFGDAGARSIKKYSERVEEVSALEERYQKMTIEDMRAEIANYRAQPDKHPEFLDEILPNVFAMVREASRRTSGQRHFDVQLIGGMALHDGKITEMRTGEGKTLAATLPATLNAIKGRGVHVI